MSDAELRAMVREVLREALATRGSNSIHSRAAPVSQPDPPLPGKNRTEPRPTHAETVHISTDADLAAFVRKVATLCADPATAAALRDGRHRFTLAGALATPPEANGSATLSGTITETRIAKLAPGTTATLAKGAVVTPLARDRARAMGIRIERSR